MDRSFALFVLAASCFAGTSGDVEIAVSRGSLRAGESIVLSVPGSPHPGSRFRWFVSRGRLGVPTDRATVMFTLPVDGRVRVRCLEERDHSRLLRNTELLIAQNTRLQAGEPSVTRTPYDIARGGFVPSGWMGEGAKKALRTETSSDAPPGARGSRRWVYTPVKGGDGWAGVAYQYPAGNWGDHEGRNLGGQGYTELSVWARGVADKSGRYPIVQFKAGGGADPAKKHQASFDAESDFIELTGTWKRYTVSLIGKQLDSVIAAFTFVLRSDDHPVGAELLLGPIEYR